MSNFPQKTGRLPGEIFGGLPRDIKFFSSFLKEVSKKVFVQHDDFSILFVKVMNLPADAEKNPF